MIRQSRSASWVSKAAAALLAVGTVVTGTVAAQTTQTLPDAWKYEAIIYGYLPQIGGTANFKTGTSANISVDASKIIDNLKFAFMGWLAAQKGPVGLFTDIMYMDVSGGKSASRDLNIAGVVIPAGITADANLAVKAALWTLGASYRFVATPEQNFDLFGGARLIDLKENLSWNFSADVGPFVGPLRQGSSEVSFQHWDAIVGAKGQYRFGERREWSIPYYVDVGTGQDQLTWQGIAGVAYQFSWGQVLAVWRYIDYRFYSNQNATLTLNGPAVGVAFSW